MAATIADLGARALRRLGVAVVAASARPAAGAPVTVTAIAVRALQMLGLPIPASERVAHGGTISQQEVATRALVTLGVISAEETASTADNDLALERVESVHAGLAGQGLVSWLLTAIPLTYASDYTTLTALRLASSFGKQADKEVVVEVEARLRRAALVSRSQSMAEAEVRAAHDALLAQGVASWQVTAIPQSVSDDYAMLTAARLGPAFGQQVDTAQLGAAEARVRRVALVLGAQALAEQAVLDVHAHLAALGRVRWSVFDIPEHVEEPYIILAAGQLAPQFEMQRDDLGMQQAERALLRLVALGSSGEPVAAEYF